MYKGQQPLLVLASSSAARVALLNKLGLPFQAVSPDIDESPRPAESPRQYVLRLAEEKARAIARPGHLIIGSDQAGLLDGRILGKPLTRDRAIEQLLDASGKSVEFLTAVCVYDPESDVARTELDVCAVRFRTLNQRQIENYIDRDQPLHCAGSFKSEGYGIVLFESILGEDPNALVGLPLIRLVRLLESFGVTVV